MRKLKAEERRSETGETLLSEVSVKVRSVKMEVGVRFVFIDTFIKTTSSIKKLYTIDD